MVATIHKICVLCVEMESMHRRSSKRMYEYLERFVNQFRGGFDQNSRPSANTECEVPAANNLFVQKRGLRLLDRQWKYLDHFQLESGRQLFSSTTVMVIEMVDKRF
jgi:hypothetical protein